MSTQDKRERLEEWYASIPWWRKWLICFVLKRRKWKIARAYNKVAVHLAHNGNDELFWQVRDLGDQLWADIYDAPTTK